MQILGTSAATNSLFAPERAQAQAQANSGTGSSTSSSSAITANSLTSEQTFLQLLVAQIQNQDPLNPTDSIQFVGQLVQYSELEQLIGINQGVQSLTSASTASTSTDSTGSSSPKTQSS
jgi:flagellar basal-body rod modification protein FlgD